MAASLPPSTSSTPCTQRLPPCHSHAIPMRRYRVRRIEGKDGFVTFKRLPANWQAKLAEPEPAEAAAPSTAGPLHYSFLAALALAVAGACVGERGGGQRKLVRARRGPPAGVKAHAAIPRRLRMHAPLTPPPRPARLQRWAARRPSSSSAPLKATLSTTPA